MFLIYDVRDSYRGSTPIKLNLVGLNAIAFRRWYIASTIIYLHNSCYTMLFVVTSIHFERERGGRNTKSFLCVCVSLLSSSVDCLAARVCHWSHLRPVFSSFVSSSSSYIQPLLLIFQKNILFSGTVYCLRFSIHTFQILARLSFPDSICHLHRLYFLSGCKIQ